MKVLEISIQECCISYESSRRPLMMRDYILVLELHLSYVPYALYNDSKMKHIHWVLGHPSVEKSRNLLKRAVGRQIFPESSKVIKNIAAGCAIFKKKAHKQR